MGGMKASGLGRRHGAEGITKYTESQTVSVQRVLPIAPPPDGLPEAVGQVDDAGAAASCAAPPASARRKHGALRALVPVCASWVSRRLLALLAVPAPALAYEWLAGDGHVHTCYSHDAYCPRRRPAAGRRDVLLLARAPSQQRFTEAAAKGLDYLVISDHDDRRAWDDPAFGSQGVLGVKAYEWSLSGGHAQMLGATRDYGDGDPNAHGRRAERRRRALPGQPPLLPRRRRRSATCEDVSSPTRRCTGGTASRRAPTRSRCGTRPRSSRRASCSGSAGCSAACASR